MRGRHFLPLCPPKLSGEEDKYASKVCGIRVEPLREFRVGAPGGVGKDSLKRRLSLPCFRIHSEFKRKRLLFRQFLEAGHSFSVSFNLLKEHGFGPDPDLASIRHTLIHDHLLQGFAVFCDADESIDASLEMSVVLVHVAKVMKKTAAKCNLPSKRSVSRAAAWQREH